MNNNDGTNSLSSSPNPTTATTGVTTTTSAFSASAVITPQARYIDKRRTRRQDSKMKLESFLNERTPRESLFELGILIMSPAPSPPPLSVIQQSQQSMPHKQHQFKYRKQVTPDFAR
eukprot:540849_1